MSLLVYSLIFSFLAILGIAKNENLLLATLSVFLWCNKEYFNAIDDQLYYIRSFLAFITANIFILLKTKIGIYQAIIQLLVLVAYASLAYDVANNRHILIYNNYEAVIYGLVLCQFIGFFPIIWNYVSNCLANNILSIKHIYGNQKI